jgi:hypothetical protein
MTGLPKVSHHNQNICANNSHKPNRAENLLLHFPAFAVFQPLEEEILEWVRGFLVGEAVVNVMIIRVRFEPQFVGIGKEQQAKEQEDEDKSEGWLFHGFTKGGGCVALASRGKVQRGLVRRTS